MFTNLQHGLLSGLLLSGLELHLLHFYGVCLTASQIHVVVAHAQRDDVAVRAHAVEGGLVEA